MTEARGTGKAATTVVIITDIAITGRSRSVITTIVRTTIDLRQSCMPRLSLVMRQFTPHRLMCIIDRDSFSLLPHYGERL